MKSKKISIGSEPISLTQAKEHLRVLHTDEDDYITTLISSVRDFTEVYVNRILISTVFELSDIVVFDGMQLLHTPVQDVTEIAYTDENGNDQTVDPLDYQVNTYENGCSFLNGTFPKFMENTKVTYTAGYSDIPKTLHQAMLLMIAKMYENREDTVKNKPSAYDMLVNSYRIWTH